MSDRASKALAEASLPGEPRTPYLPPGPFRALLLVLAPLLKLGDGLVLALTPCDTRAFLISEHFAAAELHPDRVSWPPAASPLLLELADRWLAREALCPFPPGVLDRNEPRQGRD
jgi:hypothetical protein